MWQSYFRGLSKKKELYISDIILFALLNKVVMFSKLEALTVNKLIHNKFNR